MIKARPETHQVCRSLLQKTVRRGNADITHKVAHHLYLIGDLQWLLMRTPVIVFEECWPLSSNLPSALDYTSIMDVLIQTANSIKMKDAAGLGTLGYALSKGDYSVLSNSVEDHHIKIISSAIARPQEFWNWALRDSNTDSVQRLTESAYKAYRRGGWPWDRAFMQAAVYLAITSGVPDVMPATTQFDDFDFWVAIDKHTPTGKKVISNVSKLAKIPYRQVLWTSFYFEGAITNDSVNSPWWSREINWRLAKIGLTYNQARDIWKKLQPIISEQLNPSAKLLEEHLYSPNREHLIP